MFIRCLSYLHGVRDHGTRDLAGAVREERWTFECYIRPSGTPRALSRCSLVLCCALSSPLTDPLQNTCRSFGFEHYWERKKLEYAQAGRRLPESQPLGEWILGDPTVTNMGECIEYVAREVAGGSSSGAFKHQSEHASFRIVTPKATIRLEA